jgi:putative FmdB family regulatory protein
MPIYGYDCNNCGEAFELLLGSSDTPACPSCESGDLTRQLSRVAAQPKSGNELPGCDGSGACAMCSPGMDD